MIREYYRFIREYFKLAQMNKKYFIMMLITAFLYKGANLLIPLAASLIIKYITLKNYPMTYLSLVFLIIAYFFRVLFFYINHKYYGKNNHYCFIHLQQKIFDKVSVVDDNFTKRINKGKLLNSVNGNVMDIGDMCDRISELMMSVIECLILVIIITNCNYLIAIPFVVFTFFYIFIRNYTDRKADIYYRKQKSNVDKYRVLFSQVTKGSSEVKSFGIIESLEDKLKKINKEWSRAYNKKRKYIIVRDNDVNFLTYGFKILIYFLCLLLLVKREITVDIVVLIIGYFDSLYKSLRALITTTSAIREVNVAVNRVQSILDYKPYTISSGNYFNDVIDGVIKFNHIFFSYDNKPILKDINFIAKPHKITAIVGHTGSGKTTIFNLLLRLYKPDSGNITMDDKDIYSYAKEVYKSNISIVNQRPFVFNLSIKANFDLVDRDRKKQIEMCKRVGIHDFIMSLPKGYDTILREDAKNISGGQKQLISIARTLLTTSEVLLFDEVTSSLDSDSALKVEKVLQDLKKDHTILVITHKKELMKKSDNLIVLKEGKIVGVGTHKDLAENNKYYKELIARKSPSKGGIFNYE